MVTPIQSLSIYWNVSGVPHLPQKTRLVVEELANVVMVPRFQVR